MHRERELLPAKLRPLMTYLIQHLFDFELNAKRAWAAAGIRNHGLSVAFRQVTGFSLRAYIESRRLEVADRILREHGDLGTCQSRPRAKENRHLAQSDRARCSSGAEVATGTDGDRLWPGLRGTAVSVNPEARI